MAGIRYYLGLGVIVGLSRLVAPQRLVPASDAADLNSETPHFQTTTNELSVAA